MNIQLKGSNNKQQPQSFTAAVYRNKCSRKPQFRPFASTLRHRLFVCACVTIVIIFCGISLSVMFFSSNFSFAVENKKWILPNQFVRSHPAPRRLFTFIAKINLNFWFICNYIYGHWQTYICTNLYKYLHFLHIITIHIISGHKNAFPLPSRTNERL